MKNTGTSGLGIQDLLFIKDCGNNLVKSLRWDIEVFIQRKSFTKNCFFFISWFSTQNSEFFEKKLGFLSGKVFFSRDFEVFPIFHLGIFHMFSRGFRDFSLRTSGFFGSRNVIPGNSIFSFRNFLHDISGFSEFSTRFFPIFFYYKTAKFFCITIVTFCIFNFQKFQFYRF